MNRRLRLGTIAFGASLALLSSAGPALARGVSVTQVAGERVVGAHSVANFTARCPASAHPVAGELGALDATGDGQVVLAASYPVGRRRWHVSVLNLSGAPHGFYAAVECLHSNARFVYAQQTAVAGPQQAHGAGVICPKSAPTPIGGFFRLQRGAPAGSAVVNWTSETFTRHGLTRREDVGMRNLTDVPVGLVVGAVCANLRVAVFQQGVTVQPGQLDGFYMRCPGTEPAIGGGFFGTDPHTFSEITLGDFYRRSSHAWTVAARDFGNDPVHWMAGVVCLR